MRLVGETFEVDAKTFVVAVIKVEEVQVKTQTGGAWTRRAWAERCRRFVSKHEVD